MLKAESCNFIKKETLANVFSCEFRTWREQIYCGREQFEMTGTHTEAVLSKLTKPELIQLVLNTEANMEAQISILTAQVKDLSSYLKKLQFVQTER